MLGSKDLLTPTDAYGLLRTSCSRNPVNIRNPLIYCVNRFFLMFGGSKSQMPYHASMNGI